MCETFVQYAQSRRAHLLDSELKIAALLIQRDDSQHFHLPAIGDWIIQQLIFVPEHHAAYLRLIILQ